VIEIKSPLARLIDGFSISGFEIAVSAAMSTRFSPEASPLPIKWHAAACQLPTHNAFTVMTEPNLRQA